MPISDYYKISGSKSTGVALTLGQETAKYVSEIMYVEHIDEGLKITGTVSVVSGEVDIDIDPTKHVVPESGIQIRLSVTDDGRGDNETYLQIVRSYNINCTGSIITQNNGKTAKPRVIDRTRSRLWCGERWIGDFEVQGHCPQQHCTRMHWMEMFIRRCYWKKVDSNKNVESAQFALHGCFC